MTVDYLRVSVTDRCNLRCVYCNPLGDCGFIERDEILRFEEIERIARLFADCGIKKIRLTGGEPLVRKNIVQLVKKLAPLRGIDELSLTTNGILLEELAAELKAAGLKRINVSIDSVERQSYEQITGFDFLTKAMRGVDKAIEVGFKPLKINSVIIRGINDGQKQIQELAAMSLNRQVVVRFIEYCPTGKHTNPASDYVPNSVVRKIIEERFGTLGRCVVGEGNGPAFYLKIGDSAGVIGFINGSSSMFCRSCNRIRLTSDGKLKPCLYSAHSYDLKKLIRNEASDREVLNLLKRILTEKSNYNKLNSFTNEFSMQKVGG